MPILRSRYVFGPEDAESVGVWIETDGSTAELEATGIKFRPSARENIYTAALSIEQYMEVKSMKTVIRVTPMGGGDRGLSMSTLQSPGTPDLDTSTAHFFTDSARAAYGADSAAMSAKSDRKETVKKRVRDGLPTHPGERAMYVFGPEQAESVRVYIETNGSTTELESMGIEFLTTTRKNIYDAKLSVEEYIQVKALKSVIRATPMRRGDIAW